MTSSFVQHKYNVDSLVDKVKNIPEEEWNSFTIRQKKYRVHSNTLTIPIIFNGVSNGRILDSLETYPMYELFKGEISNLESFLNNLIGAEGSIVRAALVALEPNTEIPTHRDLAEHFKYTRRFHLPLVTNDKVYFWIDGKTVNMKVGEVWEINNMLSHSVRNESNEKRIHLIVDWKDNINNIQPPNLSV